MKFFKLRATVAAASLLAAGGHAFAQAANDVPVDPTLEKQITQVVKKVTDATGLEFTGYLRTGFYSAANGQAKGGYSLGGDLQKYRLGNEGDNYFEVLIGKNWDLGGGLKWGVHWMPNYYNGDTGTPQIYSDIKGLDFAPNVSFWAGQRFHRVQDIHIVDNWLMQDGDNYGAGADGIDVGFGKLNLAVYSDGSSGNSNKSTNNARRANFQLRDMPVNPGGKLTLTGGVVNGTFAQGSNGGALGLLHNQSDFIVPGMNNSLFLQGSTGHASLSGQFYNLDDSAGVAAAGAKQSRVVDVINWQNGPFGGQALLGYQTLKLDNSPTQKDLSFGGRVSYGVAKNVKLLGELGLTQRKIDGQDKQHLTKGTFAVAFSPNTDFWTRPEFRVYATRANWNDAAAAANSSSFGANGRTKATTVGVQVEAWW
ncbi:carbohydrate porin [Rhodoferax sp. WC2427]|uniref:carbohydrate porin n=1 Tax=Rhodoferax sp. WC2427 TaxID=3234144 RepID=UPI003466CB7B